MYHIVYYQELCCQVQFFAEPLVTLAWGDSHLTWYRYLASYKNILLVNK